MDIEKVKKIRGQYRAANATYTVAQERWERRINADTEYLHVCTLEESKNRAHGRYVWAFGSLPLTQRILLNDAR